MSNQTPGELFRHWRRVVRAKIEYNEIRKDSLFKLIPVSLAFVYGKSLPSPELKKMAGEALMNHLIIKRTNLNIINENSLHSTTGMESLKPLAESGKGVVICGVHLGAYHFMTSAVARTFKEIGIFAAPSFVTRGDSWTKAAKALGSNATVLPSDEKSSLLRAMRILTRGGAIVIFVDIANNVGEDTAENTVAIEFMNLPMRVRIGAAFLSQAAQVPMVYAATWLGKWGSRHALFSEPSSPVPKGGLEQLEKRTKEMFAWFEPHMYEHATQWDGWGRHVIMMERLGGSPSVTREAYEEELARMQKIFRENQTRTLSADDALVGWRQMDRKGTKYALVHGLNRTILKTKADVCEVLEAAIQGKTTSELQKSSELSTEALADALARLSLAEFLTVR